MRVVCPTSGNNNLSLQITSNSLSSSSSKFIFSFFSHFSSSAKVNTASTLISVEPSSFLARQGPINTTFVSVWYLLFISLV